MDKEQRLDRWKDAVWAVYVATQVMDRAGQGLSDSDILGAEFTREDRARLAVWLEEIDAWASTDTRRVTLPALLWGSNLREFERVEELRAASIDEVMEEVDRILDHGDPCSP